MSAITQENTNEMNRDIPAWLLLMVRILVFLFPISVATIGWGSYIYVLLLFPALYYSRGWSKLAPWERRLMLSYVLAFVVMSLSLLNAEDLREGVKALERYLRMGLIVPIYLMFRSYRLSMGKELALGAGVACILMGLQAFYQVEIENMRFAEGYYHKIVFGDLAVLWASLAIVVAITLVDDWKLRTALIIAILLAIYASILSQTRGSWLFIPVIPTILLWSQWERWRAHRGWVLFSLITLVIVAATAASHSERFKSAVERGSHDLEMFAQNPEAGSSWGIRLNLWRNSILLLKETPFLGTGVGDFEADMKRMVDDGRSWNPHVARFGHAHSIYFDTLAKGGTLGFSATLTAYLLLPLFAFIRLLRRVSEPMGRFYAIGGVMLIAAYSTFGISEGLWSRNPFVTTYVICLVVLLAGAVNSVQQPIEKCD